MKRYALLLLLSAGCLSTVVDPRPDGRTYEVSTRKLCGLTISKTEQPVQTQTQKARARASNSYRWIGTACGIAAVIAFVVGYITHLREAAGAGVILGLGSVGFMWLSIAGLSWWAIAAGVVACIIAILLHLRLINFDIITKLRGKND